MILPLPIVYWHCVCVLSNYVYIVLMDREITSHHKTHCGACSGIIYVAKTDNHSMIRQASPLHVGSATVHTYSVGESTLPQTMYV